MPLSINITEHLKWPIEKSHSMQASTLLIAAKFRVTPTVFSDELTSIYSVAPEM